MKSLIIRSGQFSILFVVLVLFLSNLALAEKTTEIYKWVDKDGRVHYAARPGNKTAQKMHLGSKIFHKQSATAMQNQKQQKNKEREKLCQDSRDTLEKYKKAPFLYRFDEAKQQKIRLTDAEAREAYEQVEKDVSYWCGSPVANKKQ